MINVLILNKKKKFVCIKLFSNFVIPQNKLAYKILKHNLCSF